MPQSPDTPNSAPSVKQTAAMYLTPKDLSERWRHSISVPTLANWRCASSRIKGPPYIKAGGRILYPVAKLDEWEALPGAKRRRTPCAHNGGKQRLNADLRPTRNVREGATKDMSDRASTNRPDIGATGCGLAVLGGLFGALAKAAAKLFSSQHDKTHCAAASRINRWSLVIPRARIETARAPRRFV